jgi:hypothetical protein
MHRRLPHKGAALELTGAGKLRRWQKGTYCKINTAEDQFSSINVSSYSFSTVRAAALAVTTQAVSGLYLVDLYSSTRDAAFGIAAAMERISLLYSSTDRLAVAPFFPTSAGSELRHVSRAQRSVALVLGPVQSCVGNSIHHYWLRASEALCGTAFL